MLSIARSKQMAQVSAIYVCTNSCGGSIKLTGVTLISGCALEFKRVFPCKFDALNSRVDVKKRTFGPLRPMFWSTRDPSLHFVRSAWNPSYPCNNKSEQNAVQILPRATILHPVQYTSTAVGIPTEIYDMHTQYSTDGCKKQDVATHNTLIHSLPVNVFTKCLLVCQLFTAWSRDSHKLSRGDLKVLLRQNVDFHLNGPVLCKINTMKMPLRW